MALRSYKPAKNTPDFAFRPLIFSIYPNHIDMRLLPPASADMFAARNKK